MKPQKYANKNHKFRKMVTREWAEYEKNKLMKKKWKKLLMPEVIDTLPKKLANNFASFKFDHVDTEVNLDANIFLHGGIGKGKTVDAAYYYVDKVKQIYMKRGSLIGTTFHFINFPEFFMLMQNRALEAHDLIQKYMNCDVLVLDEFGVSNTTSFVDNSLYVLINGRSVNQKPTIFTSNFTLDKISEIYDSRLVRRIENDDNCVVIEK